MKISLTTIGLILVSVGLVLKFGYIKTGFGLIGFDLAMTTVSYLVARQKINNLRNQMVSMNFPHTH